jgi:predicted branched-subunit amino acid permease
MVIGLLLLGSACGTIAAGAALLAGKSLLSAFLIYAGSSAFFVVGFATICALKPLSRGPQGAIFPDR